MAILGGMADVTQILFDIEKGDPQAAAELLPLVYDELRKRAAARLTEVRADHTLQPTALGPEADLRLVGGGQSNDWDGRGHFFAAAAEAMRRILVESARRKIRLKRGGGSAQAQAPDDLPAPSAPVEDVLAVGEALDDLTAKNATAGELVKLHYFAGFTIEQSADLLGISHRTAYRTWSFARAWLFRALGGDSSTEEKLHVT